MLAYRAHIALGADWTFDPRLGAGIVNTKITAEANGVDLEVRHHYGAVSGGVGFSYHLWRGLSVGLGADYFGSRFNDSAILYGASLEWRFGS